MFLQRSVESCMVGALFACSSCSRFRFDSMVGSCHNSDLKWPFLEALDGLGYLIPFPLRRPHDFQFGTRLVLPLYDQTTVDKCRRVVEAGA